MAGSMDMNKREKYENEKKDREYLATKLRFSKFKMFFAGLSFATLSFMGAHPINTNYWPLKTLEILALTFLFSAGTILLAHLAEYKTNIEHANIFLKKLIELIFLREKVYWFFFIVGMALMVLDRSILLFLN